MIEAKKIYKTFGQTKVLNGVSFNINRGEVVSIVGPSGAGKTTLLYILGTLIKPDKRNETSIILDNIDITSYNDSQLCKFRNLSLGFVFQFHQLLPEFSAIENVCIPAFIARKNRNEVEKKALNLLNFFGLKNKSDNMPKMLSGGEQQRVAVARALINNPKLILADEPTGNLDSVSANNLNDYFFKLRDEFDTSIVMVTHNSELAERADRTLKLIDGKWL
ncbi:MAG: ABC transporter ATP-binding protein [Bacteroidota bacterium]|nr:ABC transporter ATP-binding protein [Bacteroidota bacterium]MEC8098331.1 ABC transporter ATP-binding protein [Bacteroidota bacterium]MEC9161105.1 ABC transporter ATP-binding protein [Bacteroidota bacterium]|tara:strand:- start:298 stop:957 length:660 start_codon:yes stop_codon:yes gene_type:complete